MPFHDFLNAFTAFHYPPKNQRTQNRTASSSSATAGVDGLALLEMEAVKKKYGDKGVLYRNEAMFFFGSQDATPLNVIREKYPDAGVWDAFYKEELYQALLPLCRLAYLEEQNGSAEEHAFKLSIVFKDKQAALNYLSHFTKWNPCHYLVHDACLFTLPSPEDCSFKDWQAKANANNNMLNPRFRELLPHANAIETAAKEVEKRKGYGLVRMSQNPGAIPTAELETALSTNHGYVLFEQRIYFIDTSLLVTQLPVCKHDDLDPLFPVEFNTLVTATQSQLSLITSLTGHTQRKIPVDRASITVKEKELLKTTQAYKKLEKTSRLDLTQAEKDTRKAHLSKLSKQISSLRLELAKLGSWLPVRDASVVLLQAFYECYRDLNKAHKLLIDNGINQQNMALLSILPRQSDEQSIPNITLDGASIGYPGYYLTKLDTQSDQGAALAACLGTITHCCQHLGGAGHDCVVHGISSPHGGFYVLFKGDVQYPDFNDAVVGQAWAWSGAEGELCLDSIEQNNKFPASTKMLIDMYRYLGFMLCTSAEFRPYKINQVNTGTQSGITAQVAFKDYRIFHPMQPRDYSGHRDSSSQHLLTKGGIPFLFYGIAHAIEFQQIIHKTTSDFFHELLDVDAAFKDNPGIQEVITFMIYTEPAIIQDEKQTPLYHMLRAAEEQQRFNELDGLIRINRQYIEALNNHRVDLALLEQGAYINALSHDGNSALHIAVCHEHSRLADCVLEKGINLDIRDCDGRTALIPALKSTHHVGRDIARQLIEKGANPDIKDKSKDSALIIAVQNNDLAMVQCLVEHGADIEIVDGNMKAAIFWAAVAGNQDIFNYLLGKNPRLNGISSGAKYNLLMAAVDGGNTGIVETLLAHDKQINWNYQNIHRRTALLVAIYKEGREGREGHVDKEAFAMVRCLVEHGADIETHTDDMNAAAETGNWGIFSYLLKKNPRLNLINSESRSRLLMAAASGGEMDILDMLLSRDDLIDWTYQNNQGETVLHIVSVNIDVFGILFKKIPDKDILAVLSLTDHDGRTVMHLRALHPELWKIILERIPEKYLRDMFRKPENRGRTILHEARFYPQSLQILLKSIPKGDLVEVLSLTDNKGTTVLYEAIFQFQSLKIILQHILTEHLPEMLSQTDQRGNTMLHMAVRENLIPALKMLLEHIPAEHLLDRLRPTNSNGDTALHVVAGENLIPALKIFLEHIPTEHRLAMLSLPDKNGKTILHRAIFQPASSLKIFLREIPTEQLPDMYRLTDIFGNTVLHAVVHDATSALKIFLKHIPAAHKLDMLSLPDGQGNSTLHNALESYELYRRPLMLILDSILARELPLVFAIATNMTWQVSSEAKEEITRRIQSAASRLRPSALVDLSIFSHAGQTADPGGGNGLGQNSKSITMTEAE